MDIIRVLVGTLCGQYLDRQQHGRPLLEGLEHVGFHQRRPRALTHHSGAAHAAHAWAGPVEAGLNDALGWCVSEWRGEFAGEAGGNI